tara:strand:+ start:1024 stop:1725 length:702 start_codon:yes stop_codon:yes gene_type:complete
MSQTRKQFKVPPKRYHPKGLSILFEDQDIIVVDKSCGLLSVSTDKEAELTAHFLLGQYVKKGNSKSKNRVFIVHRIDKHTSGVLIFAKTEQAKRFLQDEWKSFSKTYHTVVAGKMPEQEGQIVSYLTENRAFRVYSVQDASLGKLSKTNYQVLKETEEYSLLKINLLTGRKNQIRVHLADLDRPILGDKVYGIKSNDVNRLMLHSSSLAFIHPVTKKKMTVEATLPKEFSKFG